MTDLNKLRKFLTKGYRDAYLDGHVRSTIAMQIKALREKAGLSQSEFANRLGTTQSVVSRLESTDYGRVSLQTLLDVAEASDVALLVRFVDHSTFLDWAADVTPVTLQPNDIFETVAEIERAVSGVVVDLFSRIGSRKEAEQGQEAFRQPELARASIALNNRSQQQGGEPNYLMRAAG